MSFTERIFQWLFRRRVPPAQCDLNDGADEGSLEQIPDLDDKVEALQLFLKAIEHDDDESTWYYWADHKIIHHVNGFSPKECERFVMELPGWSEASLYHLADPCTETTNPALDGCFVYCLAFLAIDDNERLHYLLENLGAYVHNVRSGTQPIRLYDELQDKVLRMIERSIKSTWYESVLTQIARKRDLEAQTGSASTA